MKVVVLGFGTVGVSLARAFAANAGDYAKRGVRFELVAVADSTSAVVDRQGLDPLALVTKKESTGRVGSSKADILELIRSVDADVVVELTPANPKDGEPALGHIREALASSKPVVTANKMPLALHYKELMQEARREGVNLLYGACVGGGVPILETGRACALAERVDAIDAVLNATSNFVLTKMSEDGKDYAAALAEAKTLGYAEADPQVDVGGLDAAAKLVILANHVMGKELSLRDVNPLVGIDGVTPEAIRGAAGRGKVVKLLARIHGSPAVRPEEVEKGEPLDVKGTNNVAIFRCQDSGDRVVSGPAGGGVSTSRAVLRDLLMLASGERS
jgi:homoserine dehydrogenase